MPIESKQETASTDGLLDEPSFRVLPFSRLASSSERGSRGTRMSEPDGEVLELLQGWERGEVGALERLMPLVKQELHSMACRYMSRERRNHTLQPTAVVNEVYLRLVDRDRVSWKSRAHFFGFAAQLMRRLLIDYARIRNADKRLGGLKPLPLDEARDVAEGRDAQLLALDDALTSLAKLDDRQSRVVELHFFAGLSFTEIGELLGISSTTVKRDWKAARLWLFEEIRSSPGKG